MEWNRDFDNYGWAVSMQMWTTQRGLYPQRNKFDMSEIFEERKKGNRKRREEDEERKKRGGAALCICYPHPSGAGSTILRVRIHENLPAPKTKMYN